MQNLFLKQTLPNLSQGSQFNSLKGKQSDSTIDNVTEVLL